MMILHGVLHDGQAKAGTTGLFGMALIHTIEALKHLVLMFGRNTDTGILHAQQNFTGLLCNGLSIGAGDGLCHEDIAG